MTRSKDAWFMRWFWLPVHWKGWVFYFVVIPTFLGLALMLSPFLDGGPREAIPAGIALLVVAVGLNLFVIRKSV